MRKVLLSLCAGALALTASAETTVFFMEGTHPCRYNGNGNIVEVPIGTTLTNKAQDANCLSKIVLTKALVSNNVEISEDRIRQSGSTFLTDAPTYYTRCGFIDFRAKQALRITPAAGLTVTSIKIKGNKINNDGQFQIVEGANVGSDNATNEKLNITATSTASTLNDTAQVWTGSINKPFHIYASKNAQAMYIEITTEGTSNQVAIPVSNKKLPLIGKSHKIELTCATEGAKIYYTIDSDYKGTANTVDIANATLYTGPFSLEKDAVIRAIAVKDGMTNSFPIYQEYYVVPDYALVADFNYNDPFSLTDIDGKPFATKVINGWMSHDSANGGFAKTLHSEIGETTVIDPKTETMFTLTAGTGTISSSSSFGAGTEFRPAQNAAFAFTAPSDYYVSAVLIVSSMASNGIGLKSGVTGEFAPSPVHAAYYIYRNTDKNTYAPEFVATYSKQYVDHAYVFMAPVEGNSGIDGIEVDEANAPVEYFNLQGVRVVNPANGIYIKRQGSKATKVLLK